MGKVLTLRLNELDLNLMEEAKVIIDETVHLDVSDSVLLKTALTYYVLSLKNDRSILLCR